MRDETPTVLLVGSDGRTTGQYADWLDEQYEVRRVESARAVTPAGARISLVDAEALDLPAPQVAGALRHPDEETAVALLTTTPPAFDYVRAGYDRCLLKPVSRDDLLDAVGGLCRRVEYVVGLDELFSLATRRAKDHPDGTESHLEDRVREVRARLDDALLELTEDGDFEALYRAIERDFDDDGPLT
jgi:DNA-binding response OmpR family regulator